MEHYCPNRKVYIYFVKSARKDNEVVKRGESYIRVRKDRFSEVERFKDEEHLNKKYPIPSFQKNYNYEISLLNRFKKELIDNKNLTATKFLKSIGFKWPK